ncbi:lipoate--protein ligase [Caldibacillus thermolactis]|jgi:lipoate---protein ligase|uniref:lipoate--protein ligase n=1 Tax=Pallidibacillus thermolactis TaxID=251051 RepID=A0ABT2WIX9_9BACI|nr:lipoate--protein ligase [Pallidibacillus thermolactis]MCU9594946.1 lipoate--protein ligase [Pallidibacillus thermolactis]MCU9601824.1 lipoate--protein ligase [Pallidibacillus thermolactis subsp. kokeshiiformis]MED1674064.1 lipoate--protein ligase [Pallidibacillus thermolactis subsp. kokeshiiformis]
MLYVDNKGITDPRVNLAIEEHILKNLDINESYLLFYINQPSIIIGRNQNTIEEINTKFVEENDIIVVRRMSGGGAVYHDLENLNYSFITKDEGNSIQENFKKFTQPVINALRKLGANAQLMGRNDIEIDGKKVSGTAQYATGGRMYTHGTLMLNVDLDSVSKALKPKKEKIESKGVKSVRARVGNIKDYINQDMTVEEFKQYILKSVFEEQGLDVQEYVLTDEDWKQIEEISKNKYQTWEWNFGKSPKANISNSHRFPVGTIDVRLNVNRGVIEDVKIFGDFFGWGEIADIENKLKGVRYEKAAIIEALKDVNIQHYFGNIEKEDFIHLVY